MKFLGMSLAVFLSLFVLGGGLLAMETSYEEGSSDEGMEEFLTAEQLKGIISQRREDLKAQLRQLMGKITSQLETVQGKNPELLTQESLFGFFTAAAQPGNVFEDIKGNILEEEEVQTYVREMVVAILQELMQETADLTVAETPHAQGRAGFFAGVATVIKYPFGLMRRHKVVTGGILVATAAVAMYQSGVIDQQTLQGYLECALEGWHNFTAVQP